MVNTIEDVLLKLSIPLENASNQCHNGANNMIGIKSGTVTQISKMHQFLIHCFAYALNLLVGDMARHVPFLDNIISTTLEISNLI